MATLSDALKNEVVSLYLLPEWEGRSPIRKLYVTPEFFDWADEHPKLMDKKLGKAGKDRLEHLEQMFCDFRCAKRPGAGDLRRLIPNSAGVWKMHPYGLRVYGWFTARSEFVVVCGAIEEDTKSDKKLNDEKVKEVKQFIAKHELSDYVVLGDINAVL